MVVFRCRRYVSTTQRDIRSLTSSSAGYHAGSSSVVTTVTTVGRNPLRYTVRRTSRTTIDLGIAANSSLVIHLGFADGLNHSTSWSSFPSDLIQRDRGSPLYSVSPLPSA